MTARAIRRFVADSAGAAAAEFVLVLPVLLLFIFGTMDVAGYAWRLNLAQKATQYGARAAVVTSPIPRELASETYVLKTVNGVTLAAGDRIPAAALGEIVCDATSCKCAVSPCLSGAMTRDPTDADFQRIVGRMKGIDGNIADQQVKVEYRGSGLGYAGDPYGMEIAPLVTVRLTGATYRPWMGMIFNAAVALPQVSYTLTMEDGDGTQSN